MSVYQMQKCLFDYLHSTMAEIVMAYSAAHAPMQAADPGSAPPEQGERFFGAGGGVSHFVGEPRVGDIDEEFDRWFLEELRKPDLGELLDLPNDELMEAGNGTGEVRAWVAIAGAMRGQTPAVLSYEPIYEWINGMAVVRYAA